MGLYSFQRWVAAKEEKGDHEVCFCRVVKSSAMLGSACGL